MRTTAIHKLIETTRVKRKPVVFPEVKPDKPVFRSLRDYMSMDVDLFRHPQDEPMDKFEQLDAAIASLDPGTEPEVLEEPGNEPEPAADNEPVVGPVE